MAPSDYCIPIPPSLSPSDATALFVQGSTAFLLLHNTAPFTKGKTVQIQAAAGGVGLLLVQLAAQSGAKVIAAASTEEKLTQTREPGVHATVCYTRSGWSSMDPLAWRKGTFIPNDWSMESLNLCGFNHAHYMSHHLEEWKRAISEAIGLAARGMLFFRLKTRSRSEKLRAYRQTYL